MVTARGHAAAPKEPKSSDGREASTEKPIKKTTSDDIPERRRAVGRYIKKLILENHLTIIQFADANKIVDRSKLNRIISGRKKIDPDFAPVLASTLGGDESFWISLEHKILARPEISVPNANPPKYNSEGGVVNMAGITTDFNYSSILTSEQIVEIEICRGCIVLGSGSNRLIIPPNTSPELAKATIQQWYENQPNSNVSGIDPDRDLE